MSILDALEKIERKIVWILLPLTIPHEWCHYLTARAFGMSASFNSHSTRFKHDEHKWHGVVVLLAPMLVGLIGFAVAASVLVIMNARAWMWIVAVYGLFVWSSFCPGDIYSAGQLVTRGYAADYAAIRRDGYLFWTDLFRHIKNNRE